METGSTRATNEVNQELRLREWSEQIERQQSSGMSVEQWCVENGIKPKTYYYRLRKVRKQCADTLDTLAAVKFVHHLPRAGFVAHDFSVVERCHSSCNFRLDTVVRASDFFGYLIRIPAVIPSCLDNHSFFKCQVLTFSSFCGTISAVHSVILSVCFG